MMNTPLTLVSLIERAEKYFPKKEIISRTGNGIQRFTYEKMGARTRSLSSALESLGVGKGDRVGTFAWNHHRHLEAYFAIPSMGRGGRPVSLLKYLSITCKGDLMNAKGRSKVIQQQLASNV